MRCGRGAGSPCGRANAAIYDSVIGPLAGQVFTPVTLPGNRHVYHVYTLRVAKGEAERDALKAFLAEREVSTSIFIHAIEAVGPDVLADTRQSGGGEDFSWYLEEVPGAMASLGVWSGEGPQLDLHQPTFDLDERALAIGLRVLVNVIEQAAAF